MLEILYSRGSLEGTTTTIPLPNETVFYLPGQVGAIRTVRFGKGT